MPPKKNPLKLNKLQLKTLTLLQELARMPSMATLDETSGEAVITQFPSPHGNHFHLGPYVVAAKDASGLRNEAVILALVRKNLIRASLPVSVTVTKEGLTYGTNMGDQILHPTNH